MSKLSQLEWFRDLGLPTARFYSVYYEDFVRNEYKNPSLNFPVAVRSTYEAEDGVEKSFAGNFHTALEVRKEGLKSAIQAVFDSYPKAKNNQVIVQEMINASYSGVLFAYKTGVWKLEMVKGLGENLVSGKMTPSVLLLPKFQKADINWNKIFTFWKTNELIFEKNKSALIQLSVFTQKLLANSPNTVGLDIEFSIDKGGQLYLLQARPITTPEEEEEVLTSANHKEILPPQPSRMMTSLIEDAGEDLFQYYLDLDRSLTPRKFIAKAAGMPWINLSALLDIMVAWGLPTSLVCKSVGAEDFYQVGLRPYRILRKLPVFFKILRQQQNIKKAIKKWVNAKTTQLPQQQQKRQEEWNTTPGLAFQNWQESFQILYVELVTHMQALTGAMSGGVGLLNKLGYLQYLPNNSQSTDYLNAFQNLIQNQITVEKFIESYGHRGFYESDIGQKRFAEYTAEDWDSILGSGSTTKTKTTQKQEKRWVGWLFSNTASLIHTREWIRHESMRFFQLHRSELLAYFTDKYPNIDPFQYPFEDTKALLQGNISPTELENKDYPILSGWDMDSFLANTLGRRLAVPGILQEEKREVGIGIYPGKVEGQVWRVEAANFKDAIPPNFENIILVADALDPGWIPYFTKVDAVVSHVGGLLSHASIILRESSIPSITQFPRHLSLATGDWISMDGQTGKIERLTNLSPDSF